MSTILQTKTSYLLVKINAEHFAFDVSTTIEVDHDQILTFVPNAPRYVKGVINFRGDILPVIDIREKMYHNVDKNSGVVIVLAFQIGNKPVQVGAIVDAVIGVVAISEAEHLPAPDMELSYTKTFISGMFKNNLDFVFILNPKTVTEVSQ